MIRMVQNVKRDEFVMMNINHQFRLNLNSLMLINLNYYG